jgi:SOS-response transcriptional repressor LexA
MHHIGTLIRGMRLAKKFDLPAMAAALCTTPRRLDLVEKGAVFPPAGERKLWARKLGFGSLAEFDSQWRDDWPKISSASREGWIPVINKVPAGRPVDYEEYGLDSRTGFEYVPRSPELEGDNLFAVVVMGDSMWPAFAEGDLVVFRPVTPDEVVIDGTPVFVRFSFTRRHQCTFKSLWKKRDGQLELRPENPSHDTLLVTSDEIDRMAVAVERRAGYVKVRRERVVVPDEYAQDIPGE